MTVITLDKASHGWQATFQGSIIMPNGIPLPLPFTLSAPAQMVKDDLRGRFPCVVFVVKAAARQA